MPTYDAEHYDPQAPIAEVSLRDPKSGAVVPDIRMLLDTGADITLLPRAAVERLNVAPIAELQFELLGFDGNKSMAGCRRRHAVSAKGVSRTLSSGR